MAELASRRGLYFEEFHPGDVATTQGRTITEADVVNFASLSGDWNTIHVDAEFARGTMFGERIAHGMLGLSIATGLAAQLGFINETVIAFRGVDWKFSAPVKIGDTIHVRAEVAETKPAARLGGGMVTFNVEVLNQAGQATQKGTWTMLIKSRPPQPDPAL